MGERHIFVKNEASRCVAAFGKGLKLYVYSSIRRGLQNFDGHPPAIRPWY